jgi:hypothetical protein
MSKRFNYFTNVQVSCHDLFSLKNYFLKYIWMVELLFISFLLLTVLFNEFKK